MRTGDVCIRGEDGKVVKTVPITRESKQEPEADYSGFVGFLLRIKYDGGKQNDDQTMQNGV